MIPVPIRTSVVRWLVARHLARAEDYQGQADEQRRLNKESAIQDPEIAKWYAESRERAARELEAKATAERQAADDWRCR